MSDPNGASNQTQNDLATENANLVKEGKGDNNLQSILVPIEDGNDGAYVILVHGIADVEWTAKQRWKTWQTWMANIGLDSAHKIWSYQYDLESDYPRIFTPNGIESEALRLLDCLIQCRVNETEETRGQKRFVFVMLDIGGIIVKKALTIASLNPFKYGNLDSLTSALVFANCPHRAAKIEHLEDYVGELLSLSSLYPSRSVEKICNLSRSIHEVNNAFLDTKLLFRALVCNVVSDKIKNEEPSQLKTPSDNDDYDDDDGDSGDEGANLKENDSPPESSPRGSDDLALTAKLVRPFPYYATSCELTYKSEVPHSKLTQEASELTEELMNDIKYAISNSLKLPCETEYLQLVQSQAPPIYPPEPAQSEKWLSQWTDNILESEAYKTWSQRNGLAVLYLHGTSNISHVTEALMKRLNQAAGRKPEQGTYDTLYFEFNRRDVRFNNIHAMLTFFFNIMVSRFGHENTTWASNCLESMKHYRGWSMDDLFYTLSICTWHSMFQQTLMIGRFDECDVESRSWFLKKLEEMRASDHSRTAWIITSQDNGDLKADISQWTSIDLDTLRCGASMDDELPSNIDTAPHDSPLDPSERDLLSCVHHAVRLMKVDELSIMVLLKDQVNLPDSRYHDELSRKISSPSNPLVYLKNHEVLPRQPVLANDRVFASKAHADLARRCLQYLRDPTVQREITDLCHCYNTNDRQPISPPRHNLISYSVMYWPLHYRLAGDNRPFEQALDFLQDIQNRIAWSQAYFTFANPLTRLPRSYLSPLPLVSMLGLDDLVTEFISRETATRAFDTDCNLALEEAARNGHVSTARILMKASSMQSSTIRRALSEAASFGVGGILHELVEHASRIEGFEWPSNLLLRVASLGLHKVANILLNSGMETDPPNAFQGQSPLYLACTFGHLETVKVLLEAHKDLDFLVNEGELLLHVAASNGHPEIVTCLIDAGFDIEKQDMNELTVLQEAVIRGRTAALEVLLKAGANPNVGKEGEDDPAWTQKPLLYCARFSYSEGVRLLLEHNANLSCKSGNVSPLYLAVMNGHIEVARMLLEKGADPNENPVGYDFLLLRALQLEDKSIEMVKLVLDYGARIEEEDNSASWRRTALSRAAGIDNINLLKYLLQRGADVNHVGKESSPPIYTAAWSSHFDNVCALLDAGADVNAVLETNNWRPIIGAYDNAKILKLLLDKGADINAISDDGTCLHMAVIYNKADCVKLLLRHDPKPDLEIRCPSARGPDSDRDYTALGLACEVGNAQLVRLFLEAGANKNHCSRLGKRPLDICVQSGKRDSASVLLEYRVAVDYTDNEGNTVLHHISNLTPRPLVRMLVNAGADLHASNKNGATPLQIAVESKNVAVVKFLLSKKANPSRCSDDSYSLLHIACSKNDLLTILALVKFGADIQLADSIQEGQSLLMTLIEDWRTPDMEILRYLVETGKVDFNRRAGYLDYPLIATCAFRHVPHTQYLLEHGVDPNIEDIGGRRPLHLASVHDFTDLVDILLTFKAETMIEGQPVRDKMGRSPVHFAAVGGNWNVFKRVSELYGENELMAPDNEGWTPLFWALLNNSVEIEVIRHLIDRGADLWARVKSRKAEWSPLKLARYIGVSDAVCSLLTPDPPVRLVSSKDKEERWDEEFHISRQAAHDHSRLCDSCWVLIRGINYACRVCKNFDLCFRCYMSRDTFHRSHPDQDDWEETGPEYADEESTKSNDEDQQDEERKAWDDGTSHTEPDSLEHDSDHDDLDSHDNDENDDDLDALDDLSSDSGSVQDADSQGEVSGDDDDE